MAIVMENERKKEYLKGYIYSMRKAQRLKEQIEELILFHWNRTYPADLCCTLDLSEWKQKTTEEFAGSSHEKITQEWYVKG